MPCAIQSIIRNQEGNVEFAIVAPGGHRYGFSLTDEAAGDFASRLLDAISGKGEVALRAEIAKIRRDQQQMLTALQEVARKVARHEELATVTSLTIAPSAAFDAALIGGMLIGGR